MKRLIIFVSFLITYQWALAQDDGHNHDHPNHHHKAKMDSIHNEEDRKEAEEAKRNLAGAESVVKQYVEMIPMRFGEVEKLYVSYGRNPITGKEDVKKVVKKKLYNRGVEMLYKEWKEKFDFETDIEHKSMKGAELMLLLERLRDLSKENTTDLELKLGKTDDLEQIKKLLGLE